MLGKLKVAVRKITARLRTDGIRSDFHPKGNTYFGRIAADYEQERKGTEFWLNEQRVLSLFLKRLPKSLRILDVPIGTGRWIEDFRRRDHVVFGIDSSSDMLQIARGAAGLGFNGTLIQGNALQLNFPDSSFDLVVSFRFVFSIVSFEDSLRAIAEIARVCSGYAIVELPWGKRRHLKVKENMRHGLSRREMDGIVEDYGFRILDRSIVKSDGNGTWEVLLLEKSGSRNEVCAMSREGSSE